MNDDVGISQRVQSLLDDGLERRLYSGAAAAVLTPSTRTFAYAGTLAYDDQTPVGPDSLFDLASVSKMFTAATLVRLADDGVVDLDAPVGEFLDVGGGAQEMTLRHLLLHTSGLPAESGIWRTPSLPMSERLDRLLSTPLESPVDTVHRYSCVGYITAGVVAERATGDRFPDLVDRHVLRPLGLTSVSYGPVERARALATEEQPWVNRGMVRGEVHDELSWYLGGEVGNAGLFSTCADVLRFAESFLDRGYFNDSSQRLLTTNQLGPHHASAYGQAIGARIGDPGLGGDRTALSHPGFTGTLWLLLPEQGIAAVLLTNRVHPTRSRVDLDPFTRRFRDHLRDRS